MDIYKQHENVNLYTENYKLLDVFAVHFAETFTLCVVNRDGRMRSDCWLLIGLLKHVNRLKCGT